MQLDPAALRVIEAVARHGTLTRAGAALGMTQPAVSYQLRRAEERLGLRLFTRSAAGCRPTPAGEVLLRGLLPGLAQIETALAEVAALARPVLTHRVALTFAARARGESIASVIEKATARSLRLEAAA